MPRAVVQLPLGCPILPSSSAMVAKLVLVPSSEVASSCSQGLHLSLSADSLLWFPQLLPLLVPLFAQQREGRLLSPHHFLVQFVVGVP